MSDSLQPHELQHARPSCPSSPPGVCPSSCSLHQWCCPTISSFDALYFCLNSEGAYQPDWLPRWHLVVKNLLTNSGGTGLIPGSWRSSGGGNGNSLQCSCLGNPTDRGAWWAIVHRISKSQLWLSTHRHIIHTIPCGGIQPNFRIERTYPFLFIINHSLSMLQPFTKVHLQVISPYMALWASIIFSWSFCKRFI